MSQTKAQLLDNIKDNVQLDARNSLRFADTDSSHYVAFKAPATISSNVTWTLPAADGSANYVLATDGSGNLSWIADPAGQWITTGSHVYFSAGNVGIGDSSPSNPLSVTGASAFNGDVTFTGASYNVTWDKSADDLIFNDNAKAAFGTGSDFQIYYDSSNTVLISSAGDIYQKSADDMYLRVAGDESGINIIGDGAVELYHDNTKRFETSSSGVKMPDSAQFELGDGSDLKMWHSGSHSFIRNETGNLTIEANGSGDDAINIVSDGAVELFYDNTKRFETSTEGVETQGELHFKSPSSATGEQVGRLEWWNENDAGVMAKIAVDRTAGSLAPADLVFSTSANVDTTANGGDGDITERLRITSAGDINIPVDGDKLQLGASQDLQLFHDGTDTYFRNHTTGSVYHRARTNWQVAVNATDGGADDAIKCLQNGAVQLYYDHGLRALTTANGFQVEQSAGVDVEFRIKNSTNTNASATNYILSEHDGRTTAKIVFGRNNDANDFSASAATTQGDIQFHTTSSGTSAERIRIKAGGSMHFGAAGSVNAEIFTFQKSAANGGTNGQLMYIDHAGTDDHSCVQIRHRGATGSTYRSQISFLDDNADVVGSIRSHGSATQYNTASDYRLKENAAAITDGITRLKTLKPYRFNFKKDPSTTVDGFFAHEVTAVPEAISGEKDQVITQAQVDNKTRKEADLGKPEYQQIDQSKLVPLLTAALQEAITKIETLETKVAALESA
jgi:hypothetical protein